MSNLEHLIENAMTQLDEFFGSGEDIDTFNERWRNSIVTDVNYKGVNISPDDIMEICVYFLSTWCGSCNKKMK